MSEIEIYRKGIGEAARAATFDDTVLSARSATEVRFGPFDVPAGATLTLSYQVVVGLDTRQGTYRNTAVMTDSSYLVELSNRDSVELRVDNHLVGMRDKGPFVSTRRRR